MTSIWTNYGLAKIMLILWIMSECDLSSYYRPTIRAQHKGNVLCRTVANISYFSYSNFSPIIIFFK